MSETILLVVIGAGMAAFVVSLAAYFCGPGRRITQRVNQVAKGIDLPKEEASSLFKDLDTKGTLFQQAFLPLELILKQSGLPLRLSHVLMASVVGGALGGLSTLVSLKWGLILGFVGFSVPVLAVFILRNRRVAQMQRDLPEAFDVMRRAVSVGQSIPHAFQQVATQCRGPLALEFANTNDQQNLGVSFDVALRELVERIPLFELRMLAMALVFQRQSGGSPVEILENGAEMLRKRHKLARRVKALTAEGRMQATVLIALPLVAFFGLCMFRAEYISPLLACRRLLACLVALQIAGTMWIHRITQLEY